MSINARTIETSNTLEQLRNQFNNLVTDVSGLEEGSKTFSSIVSTESSSTTINVLEDGTIIFEGATDDNFETTLTVADPTADRTITLPDTTGTVVVSGDGGFTVADGGTIGNTSVSDIMTLAASGIVTFKDDILIKDGGTIGVASSTSAITIASTGIVTFVDDIIIKDAGTIGSASDTDAISISSGGVVNISATTANTGTSDGALTVAGGAGIAADLSVGDDLRLISDSAVLSFGADSDTTLTHTDGTGLTLNSTNKLTFGDAASFIQQSSNGVLRIDGEATIDLNASTEVNVSGLLTVGGRIVTDDTTEATSTTDGSLQTDGGLSVAKDAIIGDDLKLLSDGAIITFGADSDINLTHVADTGITTNGDFTVGDDLTISGGVVDVKNTGAQSVVRFYCESGNAHYTEIQAAAHSAYSGNVTVTLPVTAGTLATTAVASDDATALAIALG